MDPKQRAAKPVGASRSTQSSDAQNLLSCPSGNFLTSLQIQELSFMFGPLPAQQFELLSYFPDWANPTGKIFGWGSKGW